jgi:hypothetical protein
MVTCVDRTATKVVSIQGDSRVIMSLTKFLMQPILHLHRLCGFTKYIFIFTYIVNIPDIIHICQI